MGNRHTWPGLGSACTRCLDNLDWCQQGIRHTRPRFGSTTTRC
ncbi:hypothetical protein ACFORO_21025 [Amycolatopsis halotolerans]|uniref:Uncharacterized protein n=1 Tax=Amycolatopsis halotolerans TaxID=330083 RepID=A0ABV7QL83_9PSEU